MQAFGDLCQWDLSETHSPLQVCNAAFLPLLALFLPACVTLALEHVQITRDITVRAEWFIDPYTFRFSLIIYVSLLLNFKASFSEMSQKSPGLRYMLDLQEGLGELKKVIFGYFKYTRRMV